MYPRTRKFDYGMCQPPSAYILQFKPFSTFYWYLFTLTLLRLSIQKMHSLSLFNVPPFYTQITQNRFIYFKSIYLIVTASSLASIGGQGGRKSSLNHPKTIIKDSLKSITYSDQWILRSKKNLLLYIIGYLLSHVWQI